MAASCESLNFLPYNKWENYMEYKQSTNRAHVLLGVHWLTHDNFWKIRLKNFELVLQSGTILIGIQYSDTSPFNVRLILD